MPSFQYEATNAHGERIRSVAFGKSMQDVLQTLGAQGLKVLNIEDAYAKQDTLRAPGQQAAFAGAGQPLSSGQQQIILNQPQAVQTNPPVDRSIPSSVPAPELGEVMQQPRAMPNVDKRNPIMTSIVGPIFMRAPLKDLSFFFRQFGTMVAAGVPMVQATDTLAKQARHPRMKAILKELRTGVEAGLPVSAVFQRYPEVFQPLVVSLIRAGEEGGFLADASHQISDYLNHELEIRNMYRRETFIPKVYVVACMLIIGFANMVLSSLHAPGLYAPLNQISTWFVLGPAIILLFLFFTIGLSIYPIRKGWDHIKLMIPYIGKTAHYFSMAKFGRAFSALYKGGVSITRSVHLAADASGNEHIRSRIYPTVEKIQGGAPISSTLEETGVFSPIVLNMMSTGETTGNLDAMLIKAAEYYEDEGKVRAKQLAVVVGVLVFVVIAIYIGFVVIHFWQGYRQQMQDMASDA
jgi:type II secretory pathway component PulF